MLVTNETPSITWSLSNVGGSSWQTGAPFSQLTNGKPRVGCQLFRGATVGGFILSGVWSAVSRPKVFAMLGLGEEWAGLSVGLEVSNSITGSSPVDIGPGEVVRLPDNSLAVIVIIPTLAFDVDTVTITANVTGASYVIGEVVLATAQEWAIRRDWTEAVQSLSEVRISKTGQPFVVRRGVQQRKAAVTIAPVSFAKGFSQAQVDTLQKLQRRLSQMQPVLVIPALRAPNIGAGAPINMDVVYASALFGYCTNLGQIGLVDNSDLAQLRLEFTEAPAGRVN